jgi:hypothetical protein
VQVQPEGHSFLIPASPAPPAIFRVLTQKEIAPMERAGSEAPDDHLLLGLLYARSGVTDAARRELQAWEQVTGDPLATKLLRQLPAASRAR